jgi:flagellar biosynthesis/type III secretory pathway M-ring protein FliF/YscJ
VKKGYFILFFLLKNSFAEEMSFSKLFSDFQSGSDSSQRIIEQRLEQDIAKFSSVEASRVVLPLNEIQSQESLWGVADPRVVNVDVVLKLKKRKRLTSNEFRGISDLISSSLSESNRVLQVNIKDQEGFRWNEESEDSKSFFKASEIEQEIQSFINDQSLRKGIVWSHVSVSDKDFSCLLEGRYDSDQTRLIEARKELMTFMSDLCTASKIKILPYTLNAENKNKEKVYLWIERASFLLIGFSLCALAFRIRRKKVNQKRSQTTDESAEGAIVLTKIVERSPDEAAKWMVKTLMSEPMSHEEKIKKKNCKSRIIDDSL